MKKKHQVFVSSTYEDLREERQEVIKALLEADCIPVGMELFPAANEDQWTFIKKVIDECDYFVLILAGRYGSCDNNGISYIEKEYRYALENGIPTVAFLHSEPDNLPARDTEQDEDKKRKLEEFRGFVKKRLCKYWSTLQELSVTVINSINAIKKEYPKPGWIRSRSDNIIYIFENMDKEFKEKICDNGIIDRNCERVDFSSRRLFESLMKVGIPLKDSLDTVRCVLDIFIQEGRRNDISTRDIRNTVVSCIQNLHEVYEGKFDGQRVIKWVTAYVRRYSEDSHLIILKNNQENRADFSFIERELLPELIDNIIGENNCIGNYGHIFSRKRISQMSNEIMDYLNKLDVYRVRHEVVFELLKEYILEPPHPWLVNKDYISYTTNYNLERASFHLSKIYDAHKKGNKIYFKHVSRELFMHLGASILSHYGAFMGVADKYGIIELKRMIDKGCHKTNLWSFCSLKNLVTDLQRKHYDFVNFRDLIRYVVDRSDTLDNPVNRVEMMKKSIYLAKIIIDIVDEKYPECITLRSSYCTLEKIISANHSL